MDRKALPECQQEARKKYWDWGKPGEFGEPHFNFSSEGYCLGNRQKSPLDATKGKERYASLLL